ncbi:MAG: LAGLIDADG family homing endonuclease [Candidatus Woesearchaeota archaeon]
MEDIVVGRSKSDLKKYGMKGAIFVGKHYISMGTTTTLSNNVYMDVAGAHVVFICGKRGGGKCLTGDTLISLADGREVPIADLEHIDQDIVALNDDLKVQHAGKTEFFKREVSKLLNIRLRSGKELRLTPEHPLLTVSGWNEASALKEGSRIATPRKLPSFGEHDLPENEVKILAYLLAEGHLSNGFILFSNTDSLIMADFRSALQSFDASLDVKQHGEGCVRVISSGVRRTIVNSSRNEKGQFGKGVVFDKKSSLRKYLESAGLYGYKADQRVLPDRIFQLPKRKLALFLNRLFSCDGTIYRDGNKDSWIVSYSSASKKMIYQIQNLLLKFGLLSRVRKKQQNGFTSYELGLHEIHVHWFLQEIGFFADKKHRQEQALRSTKQHNPNIDTIPREIWDTYRPKNWSEVGKELGYKTPKSARSSIRHSPSRQKLACIARSDGSVETGLLAESDIFWDEIVDITEENGTFTVYDISVPEHHNFVANGVIVHNSYTMGVIAEGFHLLEKAIKENLSVILLDTMGIYWTMKYPNHQDKELLEKWGLKPQSIPVKIFTPEKYYHIYKKQGIPTDVPFTMNPADLDPDDWCNAFRVDKYSSRGILINRTILDLKKSGENFQIHDIIKRIKEDQDSEKEDRDAVISMFLMADNWGVFSEHGTPLHELAKGGQITVLDVSCYATMPGGWDVKSLMVGLVGQRLFIERMEYRKGEEYESVSSATNFFSSDAKKTQDMPLVWLVIDEAHEFLPRNGKVASTDALVTIMREGRQPGISLILATQQPGKIHTDVMTQSDTVLSHRITAKMDVDALGMLMQSYMREGLTGELDKLPREKGAGVLFDDNNEKMYPIRIRPRFTWHGGSSPTAVPEDKEER